MAKAKTIFVCTNCDHREPKWSGRCPECGEWNSFTEVKPVSSQGIKSSKTVETLPLSAIQPDEGARLASGIREVDGVLGGGIMKGSSILVGGEPGIGKSTLMLQIASACKCKGRVLYITGEESAGQLKKRAERLGVADSSVEILCETELESVVNAIEILKPVLIIIDSIQTLISRELGNVPGTVNQIRQGCHQIVNRARDRGGCAFLVAHVTKEGSIAGPKLIEHMVDTVLYFDHSGSDLRFLRATKNRFGSVDEVGIFLMGATGLKEVKNPSSMFLVHREGTLPPGVVVAPIYEGSRVLLVEIQALVVPAKGGISRIFSDRIDSGRVSRTAAVLEKHLSLRFSDQDIYVNVAGGIRINEVAVELPLALALYSARTSIPISAKTAVTGELSLAGEIREVPHMDRRLKTARELGFQTIVGPKNRSGEGKSAWLPAASIQESVKQVFG